MSTLSDSRAIVAQQGRRDDACLVTEQLVQDSKRAFYPKIELYEAFAGYKAKRERRLTSDNSIIEAQRQFLNSFAYLCDTHKGGSTVTATGLQKLQYSNILWIAANEGVSGEVKGFADNVLQILRNVHTRGESAARDDILRIAVRISTPRLKLYNQMVIYATRCRMELRKALRRDDVAALRTRLEKLSEPRIGRSLYDLVNLCYGMRSGQIDEIRGISRDPQDDFGRLAHFLGRIGATRSAVDSIVTTMSHTPSLRLISDIRYLNAPEVSIVELSPGDTSPYEIVRGICKSSLSQNALTPQCVFFKGLWFSTFPSTKTAATQYGPALPREELS
ncbi:hypothetical protein F5Y03DRAFT_137530 [Xylaria venustula]|nr:hypothetical protein F5Y03DRAFT_137530 [Xylaria venustula]